MLTSVGYKYDTNLARVLRHKSTMWFASRLTNGPLLSTFYSIIGGWLFATTDRSQWLETTHKSFVIRAAYLMTKPSII
jgi:hypothetical protein